MFACLKLKDFRRFAMRFDRYAHTQAVFAATSLAAIVAFSLEG